MIKTDSNGNKEWDRIYKGKNIEFGYSGQQTSDGGYIIIGSRWNPVGSNFDSDVLLIKTDAQGNVQGKGKSSNLFHFNLLRQLLYERFLLFQRFLNL